MGFAQESHRRSRPMIGFANLSCLVSQTRFEPGEFTVALSLTDVGQQRARQRDEGAQHIGLGHHADRRTLFDHHDVLGPVLLLKFLNLPQRRLRLDRRGALHGVKNRVIRFGLLLQDGFCEIGMSEQTDQFVVVARDHKAANAALLHQAEPVTQGEERGASGDGGGHDLADGLSQGATIDVARGIAGSEFAGDNVVETVKQGGVVLLQSM